MEGISSWDLSLKVEHCLNKVNNNNIHRYTSKQLRVATKNFSKILGVGSSAVVYCGTLPPADGGDVAIKVLENSFQSKARHCQKRIEKCFTAEVCSLGKTEHNNIIKLIGVCFEKGLVALVYKHMENGSFDKYLCKDSGLATIIGFEKCYEIMLGVAKGLAYLHEDCTPRIIHCDLKPANILLDAKFDAKLADFGLAKCFGLGDSLTSSRHQCTASVRFKADVYSFGITLLCVIARNSSIPMTRCSGSSEEWFPEWAWTKYTNNQSDDVMTKCEIEQQHQEDADRMLKVAFLCIQYRIECRPLMSTVVKMLERHLEAPVVSGTFPLERQPIRNQAQMVEP